MNHPLLQHMGHWGPTDSVLAVIDFTCVPNVLTFISIKIYTKNGLLLARNAYNLFFIINTDSLGSLCGQSMAHISIRNNN